MSDIIAEIPAGMVEPAMPQPFVPKEDKSAYDSFHRAMDEAGIQQPNQEPPVKPAKEPEKPAKQEKQDDGAPEDILMGIQKKPEKEEAKPDEDDEILERRPEGQIKHDHFAKVQETAKRRIAAEREQREALAKRVAEYEEKLSKAGMSEEALAKAEKLAKDLAERDELLARIAFEKTPKFREQFTAREEAIQGQVAETLKDLGADADTARQLFNSSGRRRFELLDSLDIPDSAKAAISTLLVNNDQLQRDKSDAIARSRERMTEWETERQSAEKAEFEKRMSEEKRIFAEAGQEVAQEFEPFMPIEGNAKWNANVANLEKESERYLHGECDFKELSKIVRYGVGAKWQHDNLVVPLREKVKSLMAENAKLKGVGPTSGSRSDAPAKTPAHKGSNGRYDDQEARDTFNRFMGEVRNGGFAP